MNFVAFPDGFKADDTWTTLYLRIQDLVRSMCINDMGSSMLPGSQVEVDVAGGKESCLQNLTLISYSIIQSQGIPSASSVDRGMMFSEEHRSINTHLNSI